LEAEQIITSPNFIIAGVARSGTTSLYHYLKQHPEIGFPKVKEPKYFSSIHLKFPHKGPGDETVDAKVVKDETEYFQLFKDVKDKKVIGEASSDYFYFHQHTIPEIKKMLGDVKIILCFRNPIERTYSAYSNLIRDSRETLSFDEALKVEEERIANNYDWMWAYQKGSFYAEGLAAFRQHFSHVKVVLLDELEANPLVVLEEVFEFLGVSSYDNIDVSTKYSHSGKPKNKFIAKLTDRNNRFFYGLREVILKLIPRSILEKIASKMFQKEALAPATRKQLNNLFSEDIRNLEVQLEKKLTHWK
jgi:hypothetical protein